MMHSNLPDEVQAPLRPHVQPDSRANGRRDFELAVAAKRDDAVKARLASGIESTMMRCEEAYLGIDDENRAEHAGSNWIKPPTMDGSLVAYSNSSDGVRSTAFVLLTSRYVDAGAAKIGEITQPVDDRPFSLKATPVPELVSGKDDTRQVLDGGVPVMRPPDEALPPGPVAPGMAAPQPGAAPAAVPLTVADLAQHHLDMAAGAAKKAERRIYDWLVECGHASEMRKVVFDAARIGSGVLKGPVPTVSRSQAVRRTPEGITLETVEKIVPATRWTDPWNLFPDPSCGEDIHNGSYLLERDFLSRAQLLALASRPESMGYDSAAIERVLAEGPGKINTSEGRNPAESKSDGKTQRFEVWYYYGEITREELQACNGAAAETVEGDSVFAIVTMVNDTAIRCVVNPLDSGSFPYHVVQWRRRAGHWIGVGVAEQARLPQRVTNQALRALLNNAGASAGPQTVIDRTVIVPADGTWRLTPNKIWFKQPDSPPGAVRDAFGVFEVPNLTPQLMSVIDLGMKLAEESTNIPLITQGQSGKTTPDTFGGQQLQNNNANQLLRDVGFAFADKVTDPLIRQCYEWLLLDPDVPDDEKGDYKVDTSAAIAMIERAIQNQTIAQMGAMVANPAFGIDPKKWFGQMARVNRLDPRDFQYSDEEQAKIDAQPPPPPVPVAVAQIRAESAEKIAQADAAVQAQKVKRDIDRDLMFQTGQQDELRMRRELAMLDYTTRHSITIEQLKAQLAETTMKLQTQKELGAATLGLDLHKHRTPPPVMAPPTEPAGRAPNGAAFQA